MMTLEHMPDHARVWIYAADRELSEPESAEVLRKAEQFIREWAAHGTQLDAAGAFLHNRFLILAVDEQKAGASGCSIDSSVRFVQEMGAQLGVDFFNRMLTQYEEGGVIRQVRLSDFWAMRKAGVVTDETLVFNNLVRDLGEWKAGWKGPFSRSWHASMWA